jgi:hypothetical protein
MDSGLQAPAVDRTWNPDRLARGRLNDQLLPQKDHRGPSRSAAGGQVTTCSHMLAPRRLATVAPTRQGLSRRGPGRLHHLPERRRSERLHRQCVLPRL